MGGRGSSSAKGGGGGKLTPMEQKSLQYATFDEFVRDNLAELKKAGPQAYEKAMATWKDARYKDSAVGMKALTQQDAVDKVRAGIPDNVLRGWFVNADSGYKPRLEELVIGDRALRNAGLNIAHKNYEDMTGKQVSFTKFLNTEVTVYRGGNNSKFTGDDVFKSYSFDKAIATKFAGAKGSVQSMKIRPKDTLGSFQLTGEAEILVRVR